MAGIKNGELTDADEVMNAFGSIWNDTAQNLFDADYNGFDSRLNGSGSPSLDKVKYDVFKTDSMTKVGAQFDGTNDKYLFQYVDDEINNSSYTANWTAATSGTFVVAETSDNLNISDSGGPGGGTGTATTDGTTPIDYYNSNKDVLVKFQFSFNKASGGASDGSAIIRFGLTDGTATVWLKSWSGSGAFSDNSVWEIFIDASATDCDLYDDGVLDTASIDLSSLTGNNYYYVFEVTRSSGIYALHARTYYLYSLKVDEEITITSAATTAASTITNVIPIINSDSGITWTASADNGSNYESITNKTIHRFTNTGTQLIFKGSYAPSTVAQGDLDSPLQITEYAMKYNWY